MIWIILNILNNAPFYKLLTCINLYRAYYDFINIFNPTIFYLLIGVLILAIPYLILSLYLGIYFLIKYIKRKRKVLKTILLSLVLAFSLLISLKTLPLTSEYIIKVNSRIDEIEDAEVRDFVQKEIKGNPYITYIEITQELLGDYKASVHYFDKWFKTENTYLSNGKLAHNNAKDITNINIIISIIVLITTMIFYNYFCKYIVEEYKQLIYMNDEEKKVDLSKKIKI